MFMCIDRYPPMVLINQGKMFICIDSHSTVVLINQGKMFMCTDSHPTVVFIGGCLSIHINILLWFIKTTVG
jgi:hypothetical protein